MLIVKIAFRNIFRHRWRSALTCLMMAGGCFLFAIFLGIADGSYDNLIDMFTRDHTGHIQIHAPGYLDKPSIYKVIDDPDAVGATIGKIKHVQSWAPRVLTPALAFVGNRTTGTQVMGVDPKREASTTRLARKVTEGRFLSEDPRNEVVVSKGLAKSLHAGLGDKVALIAQGADGSVANGLFTIVGVMGSEESMYGITNCYLNINTAREFLSMGDQAQEIAVVLDDHNYSREVASAMRKVLADEHLSVEPWQVVESQFYRAMQADLKGNWISIMVITLIMAVGVLNTILMVILERTREYGILKAMGTRPYQIFTLIVLETLFLAVIASIIGTIAGASMNAVLAVHGIVLDNPIEWGGMYFDTITSKNTMQAMLMPGIVVLATAVVVSIWPAVRAARIVPVRAIRTGA
jgi:putative ABC transport system permease protein